MIQIRSVSDLRNKFPDDKRLTHEEVFSSLKRRTNDGKDNREEYSFL